MSQALRPKALVVRMTLSEHRLLHRLAKAKSLSLSEYMRRRAFGIATEASYSTATQDAESSFPMTDPEKATP